MKHGKSHASDAEFMYWVLPDKPQHKLVRNVSGSVAQQWTILEPDWAATELQAQRYRELLGNSCRGRWMETNSRYFFELEEDYEMFMMMCVLAA